jgi:superfamily I DNA and RNA helicase
VKNRNPQPESLRDDYPTLAEVRAEVVRALNEEPPNVTVLTSAIEQVEALLEKARDELFAAMREFQSLRDIGTAAVRRDLIAELMLLRSRDFLPW